MPQTKYDANVASKADAEAIVNKAENVQGVKFVNVSEDGKTIVVTHGDDFDEAGFKAVAGL
ncbi:MULTISPECIES: hypothetical protein [unclassified Moraxella]|uniref:hypothetical protein n=1 Tax=unclassified Moraxella TaxID=2685852 RepID=UPI003AF46766